MLLLSLGIGQVVASEDGWAAKVTQALQTARGLPDGHPKLSTGPEVALEGPAGGPAQIGRSIPDRDVPAHYTRQELLDALFLELRDADSLRNAQAISRRIHSLFMQSGSHTLDLLMMRVGTAIDNKDYGLALDLLDAVVRLDPDYVEGWNRRATVHFMKEDLGRSLADIEQVLRIEPRHFPALSGFGMILRQAGEDEKALEVFQHVLSIYPLLENAQDAVTSLREELWGQYH
ncbi:tetratricopeptide repeat protein [Pseudovibrio japonicus]|uniref:tetratricopeptide repeat protein n=1 Tax=Pseudovibrio japonicus TaxID=366534 RepID=UPI001AD8C259|nr:hypothetical protein [Pseudovibrio japonicus]